MANHVTTWISVEEGSPEVYQKLQLMFGESTTWDEWDSKKFHDTLYPENAGEDYDRETFTTRMGAKWCHVDEFSISNDYFELQTTSAWDWCRGAFVRLHKILHEVDPNVVLSCTFEDEGYNFVGGAAIKNVDDLYEYSDETLKHPDRDSFESEDDYFDACAEFHEIADESRCDCRDEALQDATWVDDENTQF